VYPGVLKTNLETFSVYYGPVMKTRPWENLRNSIFSALVGVEE